jgi:hypothetical protein
VQRDTTRLLDQLVVRLADDPALALPGRLMREVFLEAAQRPLVRALMLPASEILGSLRKDPAVAAAQRELAGNESYLVVLDELGLLRAGLTSGTAGFVLASVLRGFFEQAQSGSAPGLGEQADLLADVLRRALEPEGEPRATAVTALAERVRELFCSIVTVQRAQLERAYG